MTAGQQTEQIEKLQKRIIALEQHVTTLCVALDAASRLQLSPADPHPEARIRRRANGPPSPGARRARARLPRAAERGLRCLPTTALS